MNVMFSSPSLQLPPRLVSSLLLAGCLVVFTARQVQAQKVNTFELISQVIDNYDPKCQLHVHGEIGVAPQQLNDLASWLNQNGPHWMIVLMESAATQRYLSADGRLFTGMDAVEFALGHGLANRTPFGMLEHPRTGETDGAVFVLFLKERKFSYYGSDAQDRRKLGEAHWIGELDGPAIDAMRNGGRIIDAVRNTVTAIDRRLEKAIASEEAAAAEAVEMERRARIERERAVVELDNRIVETLNKSIPDLQKSIDEFRSRFPEAASSELGQIATAAWKSNLEGIRKNLTVDNVRQQEQVYVAIVAEIRQQAELLFDHRSFPPKKNEQEKRWDNITLHKFGYVADRETGQARQLLDKAVIEHAAGDTAFIESLSAATQLLDNAANMVLDEEQKEELRLASHRVTRNSLLSAGGIAGCLAVFLGLLMNWRRRPALKQAQSALTKGGAMVDTEQSFIDEVAGRKQAIVGNINDFKQRGYRGETLRLATLIETQSSIVEGIAAEFQRLIDRADSMMYPGNPVSQFANLLSGSRYLAATTLLQSKSINASVARDLVTEKELTEQWISLDRILELSAMARETLGASLNRMDSALRMAKPEIDRLKQLVSELAESEDQLESASRNDGLLAVRSLEQVTLPALHCIVDEATETANSDPLQVVENILPSAVATASSCNSIARSLLQLREQGFPAFDETSEKLKSLGHQTVWIGERTGFIGNFADKLFAESADTGLSDEQARQFGMMVGEFRDAVKRTGEAASIIGSDELPALEEMRNKIAKGRLQLSGLTGLTATRLLAEPGYNPDDHVHAAQLQIDNARSMINQGKIAVAEAAIDLARDERKRGERLIADSLRLAAEFESVLQHRQRFLAETRQTITRAGGIIPEIASRFASSALMLRASGADLVLGDPPHEPEAPVSGQTVNDQLALAEKMAGEVDKSIAAAADAQRNGAVLAAANHLHLAEEDLRLSNLSLERIFQHCQTVEQTHEGNLKLGSRLVSGLTMMRSRIDDLRCETPTRERYRGILDETVTMDQRVRNGVDLRDPFHDAVSLHRLDQEQKALSAAIEADFSAYQQTVLAVRGAKEELAAVERLAEKSRRDQVPDSQTITHSVRDAQRMREALRQLEERLNVPHQEWGLLQSAASQVTADLGIVAGTLVRELQLAEQAAADFRTASQEVFRAARWTGFHGISIVGNPGSEELEHARQKLSDGDYGATIELCRLAVSVAAEAVQSAEAAVQRKQGEIARAAELRRQRSRRSSSPSFGFRSGSSGRSWSSGSSSRSSSSRSSSSRSSGGGSGFRRSGW